MSQLISQVLLPLVLALIMLGMGLGLKLESFKSILSQPRAACVGLVMQCLMLPLLAIILVLVLPLSFEVKAGIFLVSLCPGGATSNLFTYLARGNLALSVTLTTLVSLLAPFTLPIFFALFISVFASADAFSAIPSISNFPVLITIQKLLIITLVPTLLGMLLAAKFPVFAHAVEKHLKPIAACAMIAVVFALIAANAQTVMQMLNLNALSILLLVLLAMASSSVIVNKFGFTQSEKRTLVLEVGIQNAGTAILVALTILHDAKLAVVPLIYGLLMNIPAFAYIIICIWQDNGERNLPRKAAESGEPN